MTEMLAGALGYARRGWRVFPCKIDKTPMTITGFKEATTGELQIRKWWTTNPNASIGLPCGSPFMVVDVDPRHGGDATLAEWAAKGWVFPDGPVAKTGGGGCHFYLQVFPGARIIPDLAPGIEVRATGAYVIAPPSPHPSGKRYQWMPDAGPDRVLPAIPAWLLTLIQAKGIGTKSGPAPPIGEVIKDGQRNATLTSLAGSMRRRGMGQEAIEAALATENASRCAPPLSEDEVHTIAQSVGRYEPSAQPTPSTPLGTALPLPEIKDIIDGYQFTWPALNIKVGRVKVHTSDGRVTGELLITTNGARPLYPPTALNFNADRSRNQLAKALAEEEPQFPWHDIIRDVSQAVIDRAREGEPVLELWSDEQIPSPEWLIEPILYKGLPTIIFGEKTVCKSTLALMLYAALWLPWEENPLGWIVPRERTKTLFLDYEVTGKVAQWNLQRLQRGMGLKRIPLNYRRCALPLADDIEQVHRHMDRIEAQVLIVDSLGPAVGGDIKDAAQALRFNQAIRQLNCACLVIGQTSKDKDAKRKSVLGSTMFEYYARHIFEVRKVQEEGEDDLDIALYNTYHNLGRVLKPQGFHLTFSDETIQIASAMITAGELIERMGTMSRLHALLKHGPLSWKELKDELGITGPALSNALNRMAKKGEAKKVENKWGLVYYDSL